MKRVYIVRVADTNTKLNAICTLVHDHFQKKEAVLISVPSSDAAIYIDQLLWRKPKESFLPHEISSIKTNEQIVITTNSTNINQAKVLINLCPEIPLNPDDYPLIYDLYDMTDPIKEDLSKRRHADYESKGFTNEELAMVPSV